MVIQENSLLTPIELARRLAEVLEDHQGIDVILLDLRPTNGFTDFFVICSAETKRHLDALNAETEQAMKRIKAGLHHREGTSNGGWIVLDYIDVVVHLFDTKERERYQLEKVWSSAIPLLRIL